LFLINWVYIWMIPLLCKVFIRQSSTRNLFTKQLSSSSQCPQWRSLWESHFHICNIIRGQLMILVELQCSTRFQVVWISKKILPQTQLHQESLTWENLVKRLFLPPINHSPSTNHQLCRKAKDLNMDKKNHQRKSQIIQASCRRAWNITRISLIKATLILNQVLSSIPTDLFRPRWGFVKILTMEKSLP